MEMIQRNIQQSNTIESAGRMPFKFPVKSNLVPNSLKNHQINNCKVIRQTFNKQENFDSIFSDEKGLSKKARKKKKKKKSFTD